VAASAPKPPPREAAGSLPNFMVHCGARNDRLGVAYFWRRRFCPKYSRRQRDLGSVRQCSQGPSLRFYMSEQQSQERTAAVCINLMAAQLTPSRRQRGLGCSESRRLVKRLGHPLQSHGEPRRPIGTTAAALRTFAAARSLSVSSPGRPGVPLASECWVVPSLSRGQLPRRPL
jgi:hypothetical protein